MLNAAAFNISTTVDGHRILSVFIQLKDPLEDIGEISKVNQLLLCSGVHATSRYECRCTYTDIHEQIHTKRITAARKM